MCAATAAANSAFVTNNNNNNVVVISNEEAAALLIKASDVKTSTAVSAVPTAPTVAVPNGAGADSLVDLETLTDLLSGDQIKTELDRDVALDNLDTWESGSSSSGSGSHFEFSCTQDVSDMLSDIGVSEADWIDNLDKI